MGARARESDRERERERLRESSPGESEKERKLDLLSDPTCRNRCGRGREEGGRGERKTGLVFLLRLDPES